MLIVRQAVSSRSRLIPTIAHSLSRIYRLTASSSLKSQVESLQYSQPKMASEHHCPILMEPRSQGITEVEIQAHLWSLLQREMNDICLWPRWNQQILRPSNLRCKERPGSTMLDESVANTSPEQDLDQENLDDLLDNYVSPLDESFDFDEAFFNIDEPYSNSSEGRDIDSDLINEEGLLDEDSFWAPLDDEAEFTPTRDWSDDFLRVSTDNDIDVCGNPPGSETTLEHTPNDVSWVDLSLGSTKSCSHEASYRENQDGDLKNPFSHELDIILDDGVSATHGENASESLLNNATFDNNLFAGNGEGKNTELHRYDGMAHNSGETPWSGEFRDVPVLS